MKKLNVKKTSLHELNEKWGFIPIIYSVFEPLYIRCNSKGEVNWDKAPVYTHEELIGRNNVKIN